MKTGVVAVQGDFEKHVRSVRLCGVEAVEIRVPGDLAGVDRVIIPGGESSTVGILMERFGLGAELRQRAGDGMPVWGTCMGMILMAKEVAARPSQYTLNLLDIEVKRNAFGAQVHSFEDEVAVAGMNEPVLGVFIRAPIVTRAGSGVQPLATYNGCVVAVRQGNRIGTSFHPELTDDIRMHRWFLEL